MNILCITDKKGRVQYNRMVLLSSLIKEHKIDVKTIGDRKNIDFGRYDIVYYSHFSIAQRVPCKINIRKIASVTSHKCLLEIKKTIKQLQQFDYISVNNTILFKELSPYIDKIYYTPNGVDTKFFSYMEKELSDVVSIGWVGNKDRAAKRYKSILKPIIKQCPFCNFKVVSTSKSDPVSSLLNKNQMRDFYHNIDFFLVTSLTEGTPNPALEAMSCGVPVISNRVGNMIEIIEQGRNGFLVDESLDSYLSAIRNIYKINKKHYSAMRQITRAKVEEWDWSIKVENWKKFLEGL